METWAFDGVGDEDRVLILRLLQQDSEEAQPASTHKGKQPDGTESDAQVAFKLFQTELQEAEAVSADRRIARSIQNAIQADRDALLESQTEEQVAEDDGSTSPSLANGRTQNSTHDNELIETLEHLYVNGIGNTESDSDSTTALDQPEGSAWAASRQVNRAQHRRPCDVCSDQKHFTELYKAPCRHEYCRDCLSHLFRDSMVDESLFPPRCCKQPMPVDECQVYLDAEMARQFRDKALEFSTPNRTYCHNTSCGIFIPPVNYENTTAHCSKCYEETCITCKGASHGGDCPYDEQLQQALQLARDEGWQRCQNCRGMVELHTGCNHMT